MTRPVRILIGDQQAASRIGIEEALTGHGFETVGEASDASGAIERALATRPDVCLIATDLPGDGVRAAREIARHVPETAIVMLTLSSDEEQFMDALRAGAIGYLVMDADPARLPHALRGALRGEAPLPRRLVARLVDEVRSHGRRRTLRVTPDSRATVSGREWDVLQLLGDGLKTAEVAKRLFVSEVTVRRHVSAAVKKLGVPDRQTAIELVKAA